MMEFFSMCMVIALYTGVQLIYLESVDESVNFYKRLGYELLHKDATQKHIKSLEMILGTYNFQC